MASLWWLPDGPGLPLSHHPGLRDLALGLGRSGPFGLETAGVETADDFGDCDSFDEVELMSMAADLAGQQYAEQLWSPSLQALINKARHSAGHRHSPNKKHHDDANKKKQEKKQKQHLRQHGNVLNDEDKDQNDIHGSNHCLHCSDEGERDAKRECRLLLAVARALRNDEAVRSAEALIKEEADSKKKNTSRKSAGEARRQKEGRGKECTYVVRIETKETCMSMINTYA